MYEDKRKNQNKPKTTLQLNIAVGERMDGFLPSIVERLDTSLMLPHNPVLIQSQDEPDKSLYYVGKGDCKVTVRNQRGKEIIVGKLFEGAHFGEIAMIYNCERTATVYSMNYNTFAFMRLPLYRRLVQDYPEFETCLKRYVVENYKDHRVRQLATMVKKLEYLDLVPEDILFDLIFSLKSLTFTKEDQILKVGDNIEAIYFIEEGSVEVHTVFEGNKFTLDTLGPGSVINYRAVFLRDQAYVEFKAITDVKILTLSLDVLLQLVQKHGDTNAIRNKSE